MRMVILVAFVSACAAHRREPVSGVVMASQLRASDGTVVGTGGVGPKGKFLCAPEMEVGSHIPKQTCRYVEDDAESRAHLDETRQAISNIEIGTCVPRPDSATCH